MLKIWNAANLDSQQETKKKEEKLLEEKFSNCTLIYESFIQVSSLGDVSSIYRNRPCFLNHRRNALLLPAKEVFHELPCARMAVFHYTGLLIHESVHHWFNTTENVQQLSAINPVKDAAGRLIDFFIHFFTESDGKGGFEELLVWLCELAAELSLKNAGRPAMSHSQKSDEILAMLKTNEVISKMLSLMNLAVTQLLADSPEVCMKTLFEASRNGPHFSWMWLHIATLLQSGMITQLLESGAFQFDSYAKEVGLRKGGQSGTPAILNIIQTEYEYKFCAISDVFIFLMRKRNPELQETVSRMIIESLEENEKGLRKATFPFFFKLVTCSTQTLQIMVTCNNHLITPFNVIRAVRQIKAIDKTIVLPTSSYAEFIMKVVEEVDPVTHGKIFEMIVELVYSSSVFEGEELSEMTESNHQLRLECFPILNVMMNRVVRIAHATGLYKCPSLHPAISAYASGERLQFIIDSALSHYDKSASVIQHLHAISIAFGQFKAAEITLRFMMSTSYTQSELLVLVMAFLNTTVTFFPLMISHMYQEFSSIKPIIEMGFSEDIIPKLHINLLHNLRTIIDWEIPNEDKDNREPQKLDMTEQDERCDKYTFACFKLYPSEHMGNVLNVVLSDSLNLSHTFSQSDDKTNFILLNRMLTKLIESLSTSNSSKACKRKFSVCLSDWYKILGKLAVLLKSSLIIVGREHTQGISIFEELRTAIAIFLYNRHVDDQLSCSMPFFLHMFLSSCFADSKQFFEEKLGLAMETIIDETGLNKMLDMNQLENGPSVLDGLRELKMRHSALDMLHTGKLKKRNKTADDRPDHQLPNRSENSKQRTWAVLDAVHAMCSAGSAEVQLSSSKQLALTLLHSVCKDYATCDMKFDEWEIESEFIHRHVEIDQKLSRSSLCEGILRILSDTRSFAFCLPLMKSKLAVIINESERFPDRLTYSSSLQLKLHNWIMLAHKGGILPSRFIYITDLAQFSTVHEIHLLLLEVWKFMVARNTSVGTVDSYQTYLLAGNVDEGLPNEKEAIDRVNFAVFRLVLQNHLTESYHLFPKIFPGEYDFLKLSKVE